MILETGSDEQLKECVVDACLPRVGEYWCVNYGTIANVEFTVEMVTSTHIIADAHTFRLFRWMELLTNGNLRLLK